MKPTLPCDFPETLYDALVEEDDEQVLQTEGALTTLVRGSHVQVTVHLRRWWVMVATFTPTDEQLRRWAAWLGCSGRVADRAVKAAVILVAAYLAVEIGSAFLPHAPAWNVLHNTPIHWEADHEAQ